VNKPRVGIVVPTIGGRPEYLPECLESIRRAVADPEDVYILLVGRKGFDPRPYLQLIDEYIDETEPNLAAKINLGLRSLPHDIEYFNWIGDDDRLTLFSLDLALSAMTEQKNTSADGIPPVLVFGGCEYIDPAGRTIWNQKSGQWAVPLLRFGPQLIPQPGALYRRDAFEAVGGLSPKFGWAFDFNLFLSLSQIGKSVYVPKTLANFRWHPGSLSVSRRRESVAEASAVRKAHLPTWLCPISELWEFPVRQATYWAGIRLGKRLK
jgi:GT2 family glycosyltransferase